MSDSDKPEADYSETDAVTTDENGRLRVEMESLQKGGSEDVEGLVRKSGDE